MIAQRPQRVAVLDMNEVDFLDQLGVPVAGMVKDYVPHFLTRYRDDEAIRDLGAITRDIFNIDQVEVVKGAQGAVFGSGAIGGVVPAKGSKDAKEEKK